MTNSNDTTTVLVPIAVFEGETVPPGAVELLAGAHAVILGYHELPDQTAPGQARMQFEERGEALLDDVAEQFRAAGGSVETRLVFTHDREKTIGRVLSEEDCDATLLVNPAPEIDRVYVALRAPEDADAVGDVVAELFATLDADVSLRYVLDSDATDERANQILDRLASRLDEAGVSPSAIDRDVIEGAGRVRPIATDAAGADAVVIADPEPSIEQFLLGDVEDRIATELLVPVLVVRRRTERAE